MRFALFWLALVLVFGSEVGAAQQLSCHRFTGADVLWSRASLHWLLVGEMHGSNEMPAAFGDLVCDALVHGRKVTVALERPVAEQDAIDKLITGANVESAERELLNQPEWKDGMDGRASQSMLRLLLRLRELRKAYPSLYVVAIDAPYGGTSAGASDEAMGKKLLSFGDDKTHDLVLALMGNLHTMLAPKFGYEFAAMYLPANRKMSLAITYRGGKTWANIGGKCGPQDLGKDESLAVRVRGVFLKPERVAFGKYDGALSLGLPLTASVPAAGEESPLPECRVNYLSNHPSESDARGPSR